MKKSVLLLAFLLMLGNLTIKASHIIGGDFAVTWNGTGNSYHIKLNHFRDCLSATDFQSPIPVGIYDLVTNAVIDTFCMTLSSRMTLQLGDTCYRPDTTVLCVELGIYEMDITLPDVPNGCYISYSRCCRNSNIANIQNPNGSAEVWYAEFPNPSIHNSTPVFGVYPKGYMCANDINIQSFAATDADNDSLVYSLVTPLNGDLNADTPAVTSSCAQYIINAKNIPDPGPYDSVLWQAPYSAANMLGGSPPMSIDPHTGTLTAIPPNQGLFVFCVLVTEYDRATKQKLGDVRRDVQYEVLPCKGASVPVFTSPDSSSYTVISGNTLSLPVAISDQNDSSDVNYITVYSTNAADTAFIPGNGIKSAQATFTFSTVCGETGTYKVTFQDQKQGCFGRLNFYDSTLITVVPPPYILDTIPNVFTPNNDKLNDNFTLYHILGWPEGTLNCWTNFDIKIYDRWGILQYESSDFNFSWNGNNKSGTKVSEGVYYYIITADFLSKPVTKRGTVEVKM